jgi:hypothetical protein
MKWLLLPQQESGACFTRPFFSIIGQSVSKKEKSTREGKAFVWAYFHFVEGMAMGLFGMYTVQEADDFNYYERLCDYGSRYVWEHGVRIWFGTFVVTACDGQK